MKTRIVATLYANNYLAMNTFGIAKGKFIDLKCLRDILNSQFTNYIFLKSFYNQEIMFINLNVFQSILIP